MTSPNFSQYVDLTIYDVDAFQAYNDAITYAKDAVPEFQPRTGTLEEAIMQAIAYNTALLSSQINRLPDGLMEGLARLAGLERLEATFATGQATFEVFDDNGVTIPVGTVIAYEVINDDIVTTYPFETTSDLVIPALSTTGTVAIRATNAGIYPALLGGQELELISPAPGVIAVELASAISVGTNTETDTDYFNRAVQHFASLSTALVTKTQLVNYIRANYPYVGALAVFDLTDDVNRAWDDPASPGNVLIVLSDSAGLPLLTGQILEIENAISAKTVAGLSIHTIAPNATPVICDVEIVVSSGFSSSEVTNAVAAYLQNRLSSVGYDFSGIIIKNEIIAAISNISGVRYVKSLVLDNGGSPTLMDVDPVTGDLIFLFKEVTPTGIINVTSV